MLTQRKVCNPWTASAINGALVCGGLFAQDSSKDELKNDAHGARRMEQLKAAAMAYTIASDANPSGVMKLHEEPVLRWTNPLRKTDDGAVFLWTVAGRPGAIASFYRYRNGEVVQEDHEFQSLATTGLVASRDGRELWSPRVPGVEFTPIPGAPKPASTPAERLRQMRTLARDFHAFFDLPNERSELRLLTKPLYRYETNRNELLDGALFAFVQTTDPEVLLLIEARSVGGAPVWQYAFARMSMVNLRAQHKEQPVWQVDWAVQVSAPNMTYLTVRAPKQPR
jgi:hypothetical protein